ncbi:MAG: nucleotidyl transferase AbiEii/AbiGii toxin family protein [Akkermansiaceae bacterium]
MLDILRVNHDTYEKILAYSEEAPSSPGNKIISLRDMLAMKIHALHNSKERDGKDLLDIRSLLRYNQGVISDAQLHDLCASYGPEGAFELIQSTAS